MNPAAATMYNFAPDLDDDMRATIRHTNQAEDDLDIKWDFDASDVQIQSDPICSSAFDRDCKDPSKKKGKPEVVYPIYPLDKDMKSTDDHIKKQEIIHGEWVIPPKDEEKL